MSSFGKLKEPTNSSSTSSFNPLDLLNKLRSESGSGPPISSESKYRRTPMESPLKISSIASPIPSSSSTSGGIGVINRLGDNVSKENLTIRADESDEAFEQRIRHFKVDYDPILPTVVIHIIHINFESYLCV